MACICEDDDREAAQDGDCASRLGHSNTSSILLSVPFDEMGNDQYDQITYRYQRHHTRIF